MFYSHGLCYGGEKPYGIPEKAKLMFTVDVELKLYIDDRMKPLPGTDIYLVVNDPIIVQAGNYIVYEMEDGDLLFAGPGKFPTALGVDELEALAEAGAIRFIYI